VKLFSFWRSLATYRVRIALNLKGIVPDEVIDVNLMQPARASGRYLGADWLGRQNKTDWRYWSWRRFHRRGGPAPPPIAAEPVNGTARMSPQPGGRLPWSQRQDGLPIGARIILLVYGRPCYRGYALFQGHSTSIGNLAPLRRGPFLPAAGFNGLVPVAGFNDRPAYFVPTQILISLGTAGWDEGRRCRQAYVRP